MPTDGPPDYGTIITYLDIEAMPGDVFRRAVAAGPVIQDPSTHEEWIPVLQTDRRPALIWSALVIDRAGATPTPQLTDDAVLVTVCDAVDMAIRRLFARPGHIERWDRCAVILDEFLEAVRPVQHTLDVLYRLDHSAGLAEVVTALAEAAAHLDAADVAGARTAIDTATAALERYIDDLD
jgi:hypothetical protein